MSDPSSSTPVPGAAAPSNRVMSVDALRGFDMFWIVGMEEVFHALSEMTSPKLLKALDHAPWAGFHFYDLIFPLFVFIIGVSIVFSLSKSIAVEGRERATLKILKRAAILYVLGLLYHGGMAEGINRVRLLGVLHRLAICYCFAGLAFCWLTPKQMVMLCAGLLVGYWALMTFVPVPGFGAGDYAEGHNLANWIDKQYLPLRKWDGDHDPEGLLSSLPAIAQCLLGVFAGLLLRNPAVEPLRKTRFLLIAGVISIAAGLLWGLQFPIIKKIWTSSFVLLTAGMSSLLLALFYYVIDIRNHRAWAQPFIWIGMNAITIYLIWNVVELPDLAKRFVGGEITKFLDTQIAHGLSNLVVSLICVGFTFLIVRFLHQRKIFLRV